MGSEVTSSCQEFPYAVFVRNCSLSSRCTLVSQPSTGRVKHFPKAVKLRERFLEQLRAAASLGLPPNSSPASAALHLALSAQFEQALCTSILGISLLPRFPVFVLRFCLNFGQAMLKPRIIDFCHNIVSSTWKRQSAVICTPAAPVS